tara:strand:- start:3414 stop:3824 length:411 start_codon:yes stop_codon:yes gene_type:complete
LIEVYSKSNRKLLHLIYSASEFSDGMTELVDPCNFIQAMFLKMPKGKKFQAHKHVWKAVSNRQTVAQESWVVLKGSAKGFFFDTTGELLKDVILKEGDVTFTLDGGHSFEILEDDTMIYEFKTGPYEGVEKDKVFL